MTPALAGTSSPTGFGSRRIVGGGSVVVVVDVVIIHFQGRGRGWRATCPPLLILFYFPPFSFFIFYY